MADIPPSSSQDSIYDRYKILLDQENVDSSPLKYFGTSVPTSSPKKQKIAPTITPRRFTKFFTPRNASLSHKYRPGRSGRQLRDITKNGNNRRPRQETQNDGLLNTIDEFPSLRTPKRRKLSLEITSSPPSFSSPLRYSIETIQLPPIFDDEPASPTISEAESLPSLLRQCKPFPEPIRRLRQPGPTRRILERTFGGYDASSRGRRGADHPAASLAEVSDFVTTPQDLHNFPSISLPFCTTACNTNSLIAIGDEEGTVRLVDSSSTSDFNLTHINFRVHNNAIMDIGFSSDDFLLATGSGDQTSRIIDMQTQRTMCILTGHTGTLKQVKFSPVSDSIVHTSSKDGTVQIWDLRCGGRSSAQTVRTSFARYSEPEQRLDPETRYARAGLEAFQGHKLATRPLVDLSRPELSITAFQHMPHGREHLILTASEVNASMKLWDLRNAGRRNTVPLSGTPVPESHNRTRNFGINALAISGDGTRLYAVCRDSTVYAYSTTQLALGCVPEMSTVPGRRRTLKVPKQGAAPLYGLRHPSLRLGTFYIKASLRPSRRDKGEVLAVGSTEKCPVLFPTDERHFLKTPHRANVDDDTQMEDTELPSALPMSSQQSVGSRSASPSITPIYQPGTALVRGHRHEVTSVAWSNEGNLISVSDDFTARCWRQNPGQARHLRTCGESGGQRWHSGWAEVESGWDEDEI